MLANNEFLTDSPIIYTVEEGEISSGHTSPAETIVSNSTQTMDTNDLAPSPRILIVHIHNPADKTIKQTAVSDKRRQIAAQIAQARKNNFPEVYFNPNNKPVANIAYQ